MVVIGTTGSGKTTIARHLAQRLSVPHVELDALFWDPEWRAAPVGVFRERVDRALVGTAWVADGNYSKVRDLVWGRADTLVWLDYSFAVIMSQLLSRTARRIVDGRELWNGNRETLRNAVSSDSILIWALKTYRKNRRSYADPFQRPEYGHLSLIHLTSRRAASSWLASLALE
jgi:adenylate kinase family enzyme